MTAESLWGISEKEFSHYFAFFDEIVPDGELLSGSRAREFFLLSNLSPATLSQIWDLSDVDEDGQLNAAEFALAVNFCQLALDDLHPPISLPLDLQVLVDKTTKPDEYVTPMKQNQLEKCTSVFLSFVENDGGTGYLAGEAARYLLTNSQLPKAILYHIWKLSDSDKDGRLSFQEFVVSMHLIFIAKLNQPLPITLDSVKILPNEFSSIEKKIAVVTAQKPLINRDIVHPPIPTFVAVTDNPCVNPLFRSIPPEQFLRGKFDGFTGDPFKASNHLTTAQQQTATSASHLHGSQEELSVTNSSRRSSQTSCTGSVDASKLSSSQHSSVKSLVEEKDSPSVQQAESIEIDLQRGSESIPGLTLEEERTEDQADQGQEGGEGEMELDEQEKMEAELEVISKASQMFLEENGPPDSSSITMTNGVVGGSYVQDSNNVQSASVDGLNSVISDISPEPMSSNKETPTPSDTKVVATEAVSQNQTIATQSQTKGIDLSFLDDLEAQVMDVLDDTNSFDPSKVAPPPPLPKPVKKPEVKVVPPPPPPRMSSDETDSVFSPKMSPSHSKTLPHQRLNKEFSPFEIRSRGSSDSSSEHSSPGYRRNTIGSSPARRKANNNNRTSLILDDLDDLFTEEIASIDGAMDARKSREEQSKKRIERETEELKEMESKALKTELPMPKLTSMEDVARRRAEESAHKEREWEEEMKEFEMEAKRKYEEQMKKVQMLDDESILDLERQFGELLEHEAEAMKESRIIRAQKLKEREQEEAERKERMRKEMEGKKEVTIEEWIEMMEASKLKEMTPEERKKYLEKKMLWLEHRRQREEERRRIEEEKLQKNREMMEQEYLQQCRLEAEIRSTRLTKDELSQLEQEQFKKEAEGRKMRSEQARIKQEEFKQREIENSKSKARSSIAARWEEQVKGRAPKDQQGTVITQGSKSISAREEERLARRVGRLS